MPAAVQSSGKLLDAGPGLSVEIDIGSQLTLKAGFALCLLGKPGQLRRTADLVDAFCLRGLGHSCAVPALTGIRQGAHFDGAFLRQRKAAAAGQAVRLGDFIRVSLSGRQGKHISLTEGIHAAGGGVRYRKGSALRHPEGHLASRKFVQRDGHAALVGNRKAALGRLVSESRGGIFIRALRQKIGAVTLGRNGLSLGIAHRKGTALRQVGIGQRVQSGHTEILKANPITAFISTAVLFILKGQGVAGGYGNSELRPFPIAAGSDQRVRPMLQREFVILFFRRHPIGKIQPGSLGEGKGHDGGRTALSGIIGYQPTVLLRVPDKAVACAVLGGYGRRNSLKVVGKCPLVFQRHRDGDRVLPYCKGTAGRLTALAADRVGVFAGRQLIHIGLVSAVGDRFPLEEDADHMRRGNVLRTGNLECDGLPGAGIQRHRLRHVSTVYGDLPRPLRIAKAGYHVVICAVGQRIDYRSVAVGDRRDGFPAAPGCQNDLGIFRTKGKCRGMQGLQRKAFQIDAVVPFV